MGKDQTAEITWDGNGVPIAARFDDPYFSFHDGLAETQHVFLAGNGLPDRFVDGFHIAELGFGTGLNALATALAWTGPGRGVFTSFEAYPMTPADMAQSLTVFPHVRALVPDLLRGVESGGDFDLGPLRIQVIRGDARNTLPPWKGRANAWYLDGFSPAKNPDLWSPDLMQEVFDHTSAGGTFATYTAAGHVRRALATAGFQVQRRPGFGRKRHMSTGRK